MNDRFTMPAEWAEHERTLLEWPVLSSMVHPDNYKEVCTNYAVITSYSIHYTKLYENQRIQCTECLIH